MPRFATQTGVPVERTKADIEQLLVRYKASEFASGWRPGSAMMQFRLGDLSMRFVLPIPRGDEERFRWKKARGQRTRCTDAQAERLVQQETRSRWRALLLVVKAKLEAVECGISTIENEFMAFLVLTDGRTFGDWVVETALPRIRGGQMPPLLGRPKGEAVEDAEIINRNGEGD